MRFISTLTPLAAVASTMVTAIPTEIMTKVILLPNSASTSSSLSPAESSKAAEAKAMMELEQNAFVDTRYDSSDENIALEDRITFWPLSICSGECRRLHVTDRVLLKGNPAMDGVDLTYIPGHTCSRSFVGCLDTCQKGQAQRMSHFTVKPGRPVLTSNALSNCLTDCAATEANTVTSLNSVFPGVPVEQLTFGMCNKQLADCSKICLDKAEDLSNEWQANNTMTN